MHPNETWHFPGRQLPENSGRGGDLDLGAAEPAGTELQETEQQSRFGAAGPWVSYVTAHLPCPHLWSGVTRVPPSWVHWRGTSLTRGGGAPPSPVGKWPVVHCSRQTERTEFVPFWQLYCISKSHTLLLPCGTWWGGKGLDPHSHAYKEAVKPLLLHRSGTD